MQRIASGVAIAALMAVMAGGASAQQPPAPGYAADSACRQYADAAMAAARNETPPEPIGSSLVGAGLGGGPPGAVDREAFVRQRYNAAYAECMQARAAPPTASGYVPPAGYAPMPGAAPTARQLNQQQLTNPPPAYPPRQ